MVVNSWSRTRFVLLFQIYYLIQKGVNVRMGANILECILVSQRMRGSMTEIIFYNIQWLFPSKEPSFSLSSVISKCAPELLFLSRNVLSLFNGSCFLHYCCRFDILEFSLHEMYLLAKRLIYRLKSPGNHGNMVAIY